MVFSNGAVISDSLLKQLPDAVCEGINLTWAEYSSNEFLKSESFLFAIFEWASVADIWSLLSKFWLFKFIKLMSSFFGEGSKRALKLMRLLGLIWVYFCMIFLLIFSKSILVRVFSSFCSVICLSALASGCSSFIFYKFKLLLICSPGLLTGTFSCISFDFETISDKPSVWLVFMPGSET